MHSTRLRTIRSFSAGPAAPYEAGDPPDSPRESHRSTAKSISITSRWTSLAQYIWISPSTRTMSNRAKWATPSAVSRTTR
jgi:hypothetical protein